MRLGWVGCASLGAMFGCGVIVVRPAAEAPGEATAAPPALAPAAERAREDDEPRGRGPQIAVMDLEPSLAHARDTLATDPHGAATELAAIRKEILSRFTKLESTQAPLADARRVRADNPFHADSISREGKALLAATFTLRAGLWAAQGKVEDAFRELIVPTSTFDVTPCADTECQRARGAVAGKYQGVCWDFGSSGCAPRLDDDDFAFDRSKPTLFARATVKKVVAHGGTVDVLTGDVSAADIDTCKARVGTDKAADVNERRVLLERTTWCKAIQSERRAGWRITHHLGQTAVKLQAGDEVLLAADATKVRRKKAPDAILVDAQSVLLAARALGGRYRYRWNEVTP